MKIKLIFVLFVIMMVSAPALGQIEFHGEVEAGYEYENTLYELSANLEIGVRSNRIYPNLYAGWHTLTGFKTIDNWLPWVQVYTVGASIVINNSIRIGYVHYCMHPVDLGDMILFTYDDFVFQSADKFYIKITW